MKKFFLLILFLTYSFTQPDTLWTKSFGGISNDDGYSVQQTLDGGFIIVGSTESFGEDADIWLIKLDSQGNEEWNRVIGGSWSESGNSVFQTSDGGFILAGSTNSPEYEPYDESWARSVLLIKTDYYGIEEWYSVFNNGGGTGDQEGNSVLQTSDGGYAIVGRRHSNYQSDAWVIKTDSNGTEEWNQTYGGNDHDTGYSIKQTEDNGYILCGQTDSFGNGSNDIFLVKTDSVGNEIWHQTFGGNNWEIGMSLQITNDGGYVITGSTNSYGNGNDDVFVVKTNSEGIELWSHTYGGNDSDNGLSIQQTIDNGFIITGSTYSYGNGNADVWIVKTDIEGKEQWSNTFGGTSQERGYSITETNDTGFIICGYTISYGAGNRDIWIVRTESPSYGCTDSLAFNYDPDADTEDFSCEFLGCLDELAINFDPNATINDDSCYYIEDIDQYFQQNWQGIPLNPMGIYVNFAILNEINLRVGDEIGVFDDSECIGMIQLTDEITSPIQIFLSQDNPDSPEIDGFISGDNISYKFWDASEQIEVINVSSTLLNGNDVFTHWDFLKLNYL